MVAVPGTGTYPSIIDTSKIFLLTNYGSNYTMPRFYLPGTGNTGVFVSVEDYLDRVVRDLRRIEVYFIAKGIEPVYFNMDRDDYKETFGFDKNQLPRTQTHPGSFPEREQYVRVVKDYISKRKMRDMRRTGRKYDWL